MTSTDPPFPPTWWKSATVYQIFPHSFLDTNGDGIGDLNGIYSKLDYLKDFGVDVLWLCPVYCSPHADMGYDVADYYNIDPVYGTMQDWEKLLAGFHKRGMKLLMDFVSNHTSNEHAWFKESKASKANPKRDWYFWRPPKYVNGVRFPPNNWASVFGGSAWEFDEETGEYYLHLFAKQQPDLNWDNLEVRNALVEVMQFWLGKGCDGFRLDAINAISKPEGLPDAPVTDHTQYYQPAQSLFANGPNVHKYLHELYLKAGLGHVMTVGELGFTFQPPVVGAYVFPQVEQFNQAFNFELMALDSLAENSLIRLPWEYTEIQDIVEKWQTFDRQQGFWNTVFIENHDFARSVSRFGNDSDEWRALSAKMLATLQVTQTGTVYVYQGQEIGMRNVPKSQGTDHFKDVKTRIHWDLMKERRQKETKEDDPYMDDILDDLHMTARDHARIPMQWNTNRHVGFTTGKPWTPAFQEDAEEGWNVADESKDPNSIFSFWKRALRTRKEHDVLIYGSFEPRPRWDVRTFAYTRKLGNKTAWVALNLSPDSTEVSVLDNGLGLLSTIPESGLHAGLLPQLVLSNYNHPPGRGGFAGDNLVLQGFEARVYVR